ncbi:unnamed protein product [Amoebophrya sp. A25]|nr:unnamed protein product [Amoebophrya sp. A25]|eukprot:GSA25T00002964001.1
MLGRFKKYTEAQKEMVLDSEQTPAQKIQVLASQGPLAAKRTVRSNADFIKGESISQSTWNTYFSHFYGYCSFVLSLAEKPFPMSTAKVEGCLAIQKCAGSMNVAKCALKKVCHCFQLKFPEVDAASISRGIKKWQPPTRSMDPISPACLNLLLQDPNTIASFKFLISVCWIFLLRCGDEGIFLKRSFSDEDRDLSKKETEASLCYLV